VCQGAEEGWGRLVLLNNHYLLPAAILLTYCQGPLFSARSFIHYDLSLYVIDSTQSITILQVGEKIVTNGYLVEHDDTVYIFSAAEHVLHSPE
jgi:hypothetical protein